MSNHINCYVMRPNREFITIDNNLELVEQFLNELIVSPKRVLRNWASITNQTPAAKIGYIGQHLASLLTGVKGTRTGARGNDLEDGTEVKSCNKIDQVDNCKDCGSRVLRMEAACPKCGSTNIVRKADSKWLFSVKSEDELTQYLNLDRIVLILMDYPRFMCNDFSDIRICAFEIYPKEERMKVFRELISNHYWNIYRPKADKGEKTNPMDFHPLGYQFYKCNPVKTFECIIKDVDGNATIEITKYVEPSVDRNESLETELMPTNLLQKKEWDALLKKVTIKQLAPLMRRPQLSRKEFLSLKLKEKAAVLPFLNEGMISELPLRDVVSTTQTTQYRRT